MFFSVLLPKFVVEGLYVITVEAGVDEEGIVDDITIVSVVLCKSEVEVSNVVIVETEYEL